MNRFVKLVSFDSVMDIKFNLLKDMLDEAGIAYISNNENMRAVKPALSMMPSNLLIDVLVYEENLDEALTILKSID
ncbi:putative signal transducing protein [uncultured Draconibacterium sp.]|uniref:putative signal transducing protein n=1 Tax=uncultured Draconibacterium sp. TaxID=1573823 RepID=UPI003217DDBC